MQKVDQISKYLLVAENVYNGSLLDEASLQRSPHDDDGMLS